MTTASRDSTNAQWWVLGIGLLVAVLVWCLWLFFGIGWVNHRVERLAIAEAQLPVAHAAAPAPAVVASSPFVTTTNAKETAYFTQIGQVGEAFGGLNAALTAIAGALVLWAGVMQHQTLKHARAEALREREEAGEERHSRKIQQFESLFFRMLELSRDMTARIETPRVWVRALYTNPAEQATTFETKPGPKGNSALHHFAWRIDTGWTPPADTKEQLRRLVDRFKKRAYNRAPSAFGPYFRMLYQTFKHVADESSLTEAERVRYANIARGQISEGAVLLLALNGLTVDGYKFVPLIERFGLLEHMHRTYRARYREALLIGYRPRAFLGSELRAGPENKWNPVPLLPANSFGGLGPMNQEDEDNAGTGSHEEEES